MNFTPKTEQEVQMEGLFERGIYDFEVVKAVEKTSAKGNEMIELNVKLFGDQFDTYVFDYLLPKFAKKLKHFCDATGLKDKYADGSLRDYDCEGRTGRALVAIQQETTKDGRTYPAKNIIEDYVLKEIQVNTPQTVNASSASSQNDDEMPF